jgi:hypothetical protein
MRLVLLRVRVGRGPLIYVIIRMISLRIGVSFVLKINKKVLGGRKIL